MLKFFSKKKNQKGFTLIELLVVIAIIGILSSVVLVGVNSTRTKAKDARMINNMTQIRNEGEMFYDTNSTYTGFTASAALTGDNTAQGGTNYAVNINSTGSAYCAEIQLNSGYYCVDSTLVGKRYTANPSCADTDFTCD